MFVAILTLVTLIFCWCYGDVEFRTKCVFTLLYLASFGLLFVREAPYLFMVAQCILAALIGGVTFGTDWLNRRMH
jgi:hypothetical protein